ADAEHRAPGLAPGGDPRPGAQGVDPGHARGVRPDTRYDEAVGGGRRLQGGSDGDAGARAFQRAFGGAQVARAVVQHDDVGRHENTPFGSIQNTPAARASTPKSATRPTAIRPAPCERSDQAPPSS